MQVDEDKPGHFTPITIILRIDTLREARTLQTILSGYSCAPADLACLQPFVTVLSRLIRDQEPLAHE